MTFFVQFYAKIHAPFILLDKGKFIMKLEASKQASNQASKQASRSLV